MRSVIPVLSVVAAILAIWYLAAMALNLPWERDQAARAGTEPAVTQMLAATMAQSRPKLPAPHQVAVELWDTVIDKPVTSRRSLVHHAWITLSAALLGFGFGAVLGGVLAVGIVHSPAMNLSVMPWIIASQTIPILAIAPMIIVVLNSVGLSGLIPKALISTYLAFFPVAVGMVKGLRSPDPIQMDLMRTWSASRGQVLARLRGPASVPYLFASLKIAAAASLVGAIVGELPTGAVAGLGARLLAGSYYGQTVQIWSALIAAAVLAGLFVGLIGLVQRLTLRAMGMAR